LQKRSKKRKRRSRSRSREEVPADDEQAREMSDSDSATDDGAQQPPDNLTNTSANTQIHIHKRPVTSTNQTPPSTDQNQTPPLHAPDPSMREDD
jgi:septal ring-binding cell division protein DamX